MAKKARPKSPVKRNTKRAAKPTIDPRQMGLFDALESAPAAPARMRPAKAVKQKLASEQTLPRPMVLSAREAAQYLGVSISTLKHWRAKNIGPLWVMRGARLVAYKPADLERFLDESSAKR